ncbi:hypothetical protein BDP81DRAFT_480108 [Colletotrichum phormii]|uniref:Ipa protein n=1 Tax=Colletotrichum phormii TaxID=359342 RepID=A0AAI9ZW20_9PEZI|nr:uncharacterized protein BDP81DRAFT_480108 [Colletotrichum phormii]KAK1639226.1 hypothetical protein BDP81DRAFT_480108 [Colletotrichum phormii]
MYFPTKSKLDVGQLPPHDVVTDLHRDLVRKYMRHGTAIREIWKDFDASQRAQCVKDGVLDGVLLKHSRDTTFGDVYKYVPDWNLRDLTEGPEHLLNMLEHRAKKTLMEQYCDGPNGGAGDHGIIVESMRTQNLRHGERYEDCLTIFADGYMYGKPCHLTEEDLEGVKLLSVLPILQSVTRAGLFIPQANGELVLHRQMSILQSLDILMDEILEQGSKTRITTQPRKKSAETATAAFSKLSVKGSSAKLSLDDLVNAARDQVLPDEKGRRLPVVSDKFMSASVFDAVHNAVKEAALWSYIHQLLERFQTLNKDKAHKTIMLQEIANAVQLAYASAQALFKRQIQAHSGTQWYKRMSNAYDGAGNARVTLKSNPGELTRSDPQLHYILRLCHPDTTASNAVDWLKNEFELLCDLATTVAFIQDVISTTSAPAPSRKKGQLFVSRSQELEIELNKLKTGLDLRDFAVPIDKLLEPCMTVEALKTLDQFVVDNAGAKLGVLYEDLVDEWFSDLENQYGQFKAKIVQGQKEWTPLPVPAPEPRETLVEQRKQKEKTRPAHVSAYEVGPQAEASTLEPVVEKQTFKVSPATAEVFNAFFNKSESRGAVNWTAFEGAMAELGFSVLPKYGSVFTFMPPDTMAVQRPFTIHRPHKSQIEGYRTLIYSRRLTRAYGWDEKNIFGCNDYLLVRNPDNGELS